MKRFCCTTLLALGCNAAAFAQTPVIDGALDTIYCDALAVQDTQTQFGNAGQGLVDQAFGSELDNAYAYISGGTLYLYIGGNLESNNNDLEIFFDTRAGGQNRLQGDNPNVAGNGLNRLGENPPAAGNGLTFDAAFTADYYLTLEGNTGANGFEIRANYAELRVGANPGVGFFLGNGRYANLTSGGALTGGDAGAPVVRVTINNSNTAGVNGGTGVELDGGAGVATGIEIAIPLTALGSPTANFRVTAFVNGAQHDFLSNQSLAGIFGGSNLGEPRNVNFNNLAFDQFFTVPIVTPPCGACCVSMECLVETQAACMGMSGLFQGVNSSCLGNPCDASATGACCRGTACTIETSVECVGGGGVYFGDGTSCGTFPCLTIGACCRPDTTCTIGTQSQCDTAGGDYFGGGSTCSEGLCLNGACCMGTTGTMCQSVREDECLTADGTYQGDGTTCPNAACVGGACCVDNVCFIVRGGSLCGQIGGTYQGDNTNCSPATCGMPTPGIPAIDGTCEGSYGAALSVQNTQTQFGDSNQGLVDFANGSELDVLAGQVVGDNLYLCIAGNLESNFNKLELFFDTRAGGQNRLLGTNPDVDFNAINRQGDDGSGNGLRFDTGFDADFYFTMSHGGQGGRPSTSIFANFAELFVDAGNPGMGFFLGEGRAANRTNGGLLDRNSGGNNPFGIRVTLNNMNTAGVTGGDQAQPNGGAGVNTGVEICLPLSAIGNPTEDFKVVLYVNGGSHDFASNQFLGGLNGGGNLGEPRNVDLAAIPGDQCVLVPIAGDVCAGITCGDSNLSGNVSVTDIAFFVTAVAQGFAAWDALIPGVQTMQDFLCANDTDGNGVVSVGDIGRFVGVVTGNGGCL